MKKLLLLLTLPVMFLTGCDDATIKALFNQNLIGFSGKFELFTDVKGEFTNTSSTRNYIWYDGEVFEMDDLAPTANTDTETHCVVEDEDQELTSSWSWSYEKGKRVRRYVGSQTVWFAKDNDTNDQITDDAFCEDDCILNEIDYDLDNADLWFYNPEIILNEYGFQSSEDDETTAEFYASQFTGGQGVEWLEAYALSKLVEEATAYFYEEVDYYRDWSTSETTTKIADVVTMETSTSFGDGQDHDTELHTVVDGWIWSITSFDADDFPDTSINADRVFPAGISVGDTWITPDDAFANAISIGTLELASGVTVEALIVVIRGIKEFSIENSSVDECVEWFNSANTETSGAEVTDYVDLTADALIWCDGDGQMDFSNEETIWLFGGHQVRTVEFETETNLLEWGYAKLDLTDGSCDKTSQTSTGGSVTVADVSKDDLDEWKPFIRFSVSESRDEFIATSIEKTNAPLNDFIADFTETATSETDAASDTTSTTEATDTTE